MPNLTPEQTAALQSFAARYGRYWKAALRAAWMGEKHNGLRPDDTGPLRDLRNSHGPSWLIAYRLPKAQ